MPSWWCFSNFKVPYCSCCSVVSLLHITFRKWKLIKEPLDGLNFKVQWSDMGWIEWIQIRVSSWAMRRSGWRRCCTALALWTKMNFKKNLVDSKWKQELVLTKKKKNTSLTTLFGNQHQQATERRSRIQAGKISRRWRNSENLQAFLWGKIITLEFPWSIFSLASYFTAW